MEWFEKFAHFLKKSEIIFCITAILPFIFVTEISIMKLIQTERRVRMPVEERIRLCRLIEKIDAKKEYSETLGLEDKTTFHGEKIHDKKGETIC